MEIIAVINNSICYICLWQGAAFNIAFLIGLKYENQSAANKNKAIFISLASIYLKILGKTLTSSGVYNLILTTIFQHGFKYTVMWWSLIEMEMTECPPNTVVLTMSGLLLCWQWGKKDGKGEHTSSKIGKPICCERAL